MRNTNSQLNFLFFSTLMAILIWMASPSVKGYVNPEIHAFPFQDYDAKYSVSWYGLYSGESVHKLRRTPNGEYHLEARTNPKLNFLPFHSKESSRFAYESGKILPLQYSYNIQEGKRHKNGNVIFNHKTNRLSNRHLKKPWEMTMPDDIQDKLTQTLCLRQALSAGKAPMSYIVAESDKVKNYTFVNVGEERIQTKLGTLDTVKLQHISRKGYKTTTWFAKKFDYLPVKMTQERNGKIAASGDIQSFTRR